MLTSAAEPRQLWGLGRSPGRQKPALTPPPRSGPPRAAQCLSTLAGKCVWALIVAIKILASKTAYFII